MRGITYNGQDSIKDFDLYISDLNISPPTKRQVRVDIPFMNGSYNFSNLFGESTFNERELVYSFDIIGNSVEDLNFKKIRIYKWLMGCGEIELYDSAIEGYYFLAECVSIRESDEREYSFIEVTFKAQPFKIRDEFEGNNLWDTFNFELDVLQERTFTVSGTEEFTMYNNGLVSEIPLIKSSVSGLKIIFNNIEYILEKGDNRLSNIRLVPGNNAFKLVGNGTIEIYFNSEVI